MSSQEGLSGLKAKGRIFLSHLGGGVAAAVTGDPVIGAFVEATVATSIDSVLQHAGEEVGQRTLGPLQAERVGAILLVAEAEARRRDAAGERPRDDGFFEPGRAGRPDAEEIAEGVLRVAGESYEQRKVLYLGVFLTAIGFRSDVPAAQAHHLLRVAGRLSWRQFCLLGVFTREALRKNLTRRSLNLARIGGPRPTAPAPAVVDELNGLNAESLLGLGNPTGGVSRFESSWDIANIPASYGEIRPTASGALLAKLLGLDRLPDEDIQETLTELGGDISP